MCPYVEIPRQFSLTIARWLTHVYDADNPIEISTTPGDVTRTRPYRTQTNGKIERFHRTLADEWAFSRHYNSESARRNALSAWLHHYNHHRPHTAIGKVPPITRLTNLPGQHN